MGKDKIKIAIYSLFRDDGAQYINRYFEQLANQYYDNIRLYLVEGDSTLPTYDTLKLFAESYKESFDDVFILSIKTGNPRQSFVINDTRMDTLSKTANLALDMIDSDKWADKIMLVESDLFFNNHLINDLLDLNVDIAAPLIMADDAFYDIWGFRHLDGTSVGPTWKPTKPTQLLSVGSIALYPAKPIYNGLRFDKRCMVGLCSELTKQGYEIWVNHKAVARHPTPKNPYPK